MTRKYPLRTIACNLGCIRYTVSVVDVQMFHGNKQIKKKKKKILRRRRYRKTQCNGATGGIIPHKYVFILGLLYHRGIKLINLSCY